METKLRISEQVDYWIAEEELPQSVNLRPIKQFDGLYPQDEEERQAYFDFIEWAMNKEHEVINSIPVQETSDNFKFIQLDETGHDISPYNTMDFKRQFPLNKTTYYRLRQIYKRAKDLAISYSCISDAQGKKNIKQRFINMLDSNFRDKALMFKETSYKYGAWVNQNILKKRLKGLNKSIYICESIWKDHAFKA